ncbi:cell division protein FtsQ/DivIB [Magnetofaba australis]|uniref:Putative polypeptide-transport-associated domain-containing protein n=1 Tax=Magnetofaba australis IT-1 TaxID=1434232 RepID=A0A1Y2K9A3_9PROT|nr:FtsQ-type POTRA domain-containing protein [Magnetofaba australis]OSM07056.1 putative polypeptide-transport-associated domain-containing protein [Magnetofaba australis IT-1]
MTRSTLIGALFIVLAAAAVFGWQAAHAPGRFPLQEIRIEGALHTDVEATVSALGIDKARNMLRIDPIALRTALLERPWVKEAQVSRRFPSTLDINLTEKRALCMSREGETLYLLDEAGRRIKAAEPGDPLILPVITDDFSAPNERPERVTQFMTALEERPWLKTRLSEVTALPGGRWVLYTREGVRLLLSNRLESELKLLNALQNRYRILDRRIRQVDLRVAGRAAVRPLEKEESGPRTG